MNNNDWYENGSWYAPAARAAEQAPPAGRKAPAASGKKRGKGWTPLRITGAVCLLLALIVASSLLFAGSGKSQGPSLSPSAPSIGDGKLPSDPADFFSQFYEAIQTDNYENSIERAALPVAYEQAVVPAEGEALTLQEIYERCSPSIVGIAGYRDGMMGYYWGTGIILSGDGLILTNAHVIGSCSSASVLLPDDRELEAKLVGSDAVSDLALLKIDAKGLPAAELGDSSSLQVGDHVAAIGNPLGSGFRNTLTDGIISAIDRDVQSKGHRMTLLQTNTAINEGNSGGALFNMYGQVIGVTNMKMMSSYSSIEGIGFAIPSSTVRYVVNALVRDGEVRGRPSIGITVGAIPDNAKEEYRMPDGLYITDVNEGSDAALQGLLPGDVITEVDGVAVSTTDEVNDLKNRKKVGETMHFRIWRDGETLEFDVLLMDTNDVYGKQP